MNAPGPTSRAAWIANPRASRWLAPGVLLIATLSTASAAHGLPGRNRLVVYALLWCLAIGAWWLLVAANALFVARDANLSGLPSLRRTANRIVIAGAS